MDTQNNKSQHHSDWPMMASAILLCLIMACACSQKRESLEQLPVQETQPVSEQPTVELYTIGTVNKRLRDAMLDSLRQHYPKCRYVGNLPLSRSAYYAPRQRYLADSLVAYLEKRHTKNNIVVGLTSVDISLCNFRGHENYGIMGLTNHVGGGVSVVSSYRKKSKQGLSLVMRHELGHAVGLRHCTTTNCLIHDAGGLDLRGTKFCNKCAVFLIEKGWK